MIKYVLRISYSMLSVKEVDESLIYEETNPAITQKVFDTSEEARLEFNIIMILRKNR